MKKSSRSPWKDQAPGELALCVGLRVRKVSGKPFKSGQKVGTVAGIETLPYTGRAAFHMEEDDTLVEAGPQEPASGKTDEQIAAEMGLTVERVREMWRELRDNTPRAQAAKRAVAEAFEEAERGGYIDESCARLRAILVPSPPPPIFYESPAPHHRRAARDRGPACHRRVPAGSGLVMKKLLLGALAYYVLLYAVALCWSHATVQPRRAYPWWQVQVFERDDDKWWCQHLYSLYGGYQIKLTEAPMIRVKGHKLTMHWSGERGEESTSTGECPCGWSESGSSQKMVRFEYQQYLKRVLANRGKKAVP